MQHIFSSRLSRLRKKSGMSQKEMAVTLGVAASTYSNYENGIYLPDLRHSAQIASVLHTSLDYLTGALPDSFAAFDPVSLPDRSPAFSMILSALFALHEEELEALSDYIHYLLYKRRHKNYLEKPQFSYVADEENPDK